MTLNFQKPVSIRRGEHEPTATEQSKQNVGGRRVSFCSETLRESLNNINSMNLYLLTICCNQDCLWVLYRKNRAWPHASSSGSKKICFNRKIPWVDPGGGGRGGGSPADESGKWGRAGITNASTLDICSWDVLLFYTIININNSYLSVTFMIRKPPSCCESVRLAMLRGRRAVKMQMNAYGKLFTAWSQHVSSDSLLHLCHFD